MRPVVMATPSSVKTIQVIEVLACRGAGTKEDMFRLVLQYWSLEGKLLAEDDPKERIERESEVE